MYKELQVSKMGSPTQKKKGKRLEQTRHKNKTARWPTDTVTRAGTGLFQPLDTLVSSHLEGLKSQKTWRGAEGVKGASMSRAPGTSGRYLQRLDTSAPCRGVAARTVHVAVPDNPVAIHTAWTEVAAGA